MDNFHFTSYSNSKSTLNGNVIDDREVKMIFDGNDLDLFIKKNGEFAYEKLSKEQLIDIVSSNDINNNDNSLLKKLELDFPIETKTTSNKKTKKNKKNKKDKKDKSDKKKSKKDKKDKKDKSETLNLIDTIF